MPSYTLHYFNHRGRAEICRMLFAAAGVQYNDRRIEYSEWDGLRSSIKICSARLLSLDINKKLLSKNLMIGRNKAIPFLINSRRYYILSSNTKETYCSFYCFTDNILIFRHTN
uniref:GST N-terminal domain-containing protein n=1 Tax=Octopus bimaculoides TaxID=37653 RepID=A0A0L8HMJ8_OCTBM